MTLISLALLGALLPWTATATTTPSSQVPEPNQSKQIGCRHGFETLATVIRGAPFSKAPAGLGAFKERSAKVVHFSLFSSRATHIELYVYTTPFGAQEVAHFPLTKFEGTSNTWAISLEQEYLEALGITGPLYYGYRVWGPNWPYDPKWTKGSSIGFISDVDQAGNRFNPNKLLLDPRAREVSHDAIYENHRDETVFRTGPEHRYADSGPVAPKGILLAEEFPPSRTHIERPFKDDIIYEAHVKGLTQADPSIPPELRGTYAGAALKAPYLKALGVTAVEFMPIHSFQNAHNGFSQATHGANYWGYMSDTFFAPDIDYSHDKSPGGPTREFREMIETFHSVGIKVILDVVYNHTGEGQVINGDKDVRELHSLSGIDNPAYYLLTNNNLHYYDITGTGNTTNAASPAVRDLVIDSVKYFANLGVDGFRFDLAPALGNTLQNGGFQFNPKDPENILNRLTRELPVRPEGGGPGVDLIAESWTPDSQHLGQFPKGWAEWNGRYQNTMRKDQNKTGVEQITPSELAERIAGSSDYFKASGRRPMHSVNYLTVHDGFTLADLYSFNGKYNNQPWPYGPSDGGMDDNNSWDHGNNTQLQRQAARTGMALLMLSAGVPMIQGGDEFLRSTNGNNNPYNVDSEANWLNWKLLDQNADFFKFVQRLADFRKAHPSLRPSEFYEGRDRTGKGIKDITWYTANGVEPNIFYLDNPNNHFLGYRIDSSSVSGETVESIYVGYNGGDTPFQITLPTPRDGKHWFLVADTSKTLHSLNNFVPEGKEIEMKERIYFMDQRTVVLFIEK